MNKHVGELFELPSDDDQQDKEARYNDLFGSVKINPKPKYRPIDPDRFQEHVDRVNALFNDFGGDFRPKDLDFLTSFKRQLEAQCRKQHLTGLTDKQVAVLRNIEDKQRFKKDKRAAEQRADNLFKKDATD